MRGRWFLHLRGGPMRLFKRWYVRRSARRSSSSWQTGLPPSAKNLPTPANTCHRLPSPATTCQFSASDRLAAPGDRPFAHARRLMPRRSSASAMRWPRSIVGRKRSATAFASTLVAEITSADLPWSGDRRDQWSGARSLVQSDWLCGCRFHGMATAGPLQEWPPDGLERASTTVTVCHWRDTACGPD